MKYYRGSTEFGNNRQLYILYPKSNSALGLNLVRPTSSFKTSS